MARVVYVDVVGSTSLKLTLKKDVPARKVWASLRKARRVDAATHVLETRDGALLGLDDLVLASAPGAGDVLLVCRRRPPPPTPPPETPPETPPPPPETPPPPLPPSTAGLRWLYINVAASAKRRAFAEAQAAKHGLAAARVDAATPADAAALAAGLGVPAAHLMAGSDEWHGGAANAICLSWLRALRAAAAADAPLVAVAEDDAAPHRDFSTRADALLANLSARAAVDAVWLHARGHARVRDTCGDAACVPRPDAPAGAPAAWGAGRYFAAWPTYGPGASAEWTGAPVMACDPAVLLATPRACGSLADRLEARLRDRAWEPLDWMCAALAAGDARTALAGDAYLVMPAPRRGIASVRGETAAASGAVMGERVFDAD